MRANEYLTEVSTIVNPLWFCGIAPALLVAGIIADSQGNALRAARLALLLPAIVARALWAMLAHGDPKRVAGMLGE